MFPKSASVLIVAAAIGWVGSIGTTHAENRHHERRLTVAHHRFAALRRAAPQTSRHGMAGPFRYGMAGPFRSWPVYPGRTVFQNEDCNLPTSYCPNEMRDVR